MNPQREREKVHGFAGGRVCEMKGEDEEAVAARAYMTNDIKSGSSEDNAKPAQVDLRR